MANLIPKCLDCTFNIPGDCDHPKKNERDFWNRTVCKYFEEKKKPTSLKSSNCLECEYHEPGDCKHSENTPAKFLKFWDRTGTQACSYFEKKGHVPIRKTKD